MYIENNTIEYYIIQYTTIQYTTYKYESNPTYRKRQRKTFVLF